jgi:UDP-N-acetylglucosamine 3-dehydrogenase
MTMTSKRIAVVVGCGSIGQRHARLLGERADIEVWGCDPSEKNLAEAQQKAPLARTFSDYRQALKSRPDLVWVCTPNRLHAPVAIEAMQAGADVLCEKPLADTLEAGQAIVDAVKSTGRTLMVGYTLRWTPSYRFIADAIRAGKIGTVVAARASVQGYRSLEVARTNYRLEESFALLLDYSHEIDALRWFLGEVQTVKAVATTLGRREVIVKPNVIDAVLRFAGGQTATVHFDYVVRPGAREVEILADDGRIYYHSSRDYVEYCPGQEGSCEQINVKPADYDDPYRAEIQDFLDAVDGKRAPTVSAADALATLRVIHLIVDSYQRDSI